MVLVRLDCRVAGARSQAIQTRGILHKIFQNTGLDTEQRKKIEQMAIGHKNMDSKDGVFQWNRSMMFVTAQNTMKSKAIPIL